jgi:hypothetical protein
MLCQRPRVRLPAKAVKQLLACRDSLNTVQVIIAAEQFSDKGRRWPSFMVAPVQTDKKGGVTNF